MSWVCLLLVGPMLFFWASGQEIPCPQSYPHTCTCHSNPKSVKCKSLHFMYNFPRGVFDRDTKWLSLEKSRIETITKEDFKNLPELSKLFMTGGYLEYISPGTFQQLQNLTEVRLYDNFLSSKSFPNGTFANLSKLEQVWLDRNGIRGLPVDMFVNSPLRTLSMTNSQLDRPGLRAIGSGQVAKSLTKLHLDGTFLHRFTLRQFSGLPNLEKISFIGCDLEYIHTDFLQGTKVTQVDLQQNPIVKIDADAMKGDQIVAFSCRECGLTREKVFGENSFLLQMTALERLDLGHNNIDHVPKDAFKGMVKLDTLFLYSSNITTIEENPFAPLSSLTSFGIQGNPFKCNCNLSWFHTYVSENFEHKRKDIKSAAPSNLAGKAFNELQVSQFCCEPGGNATSVCSGAVKSTPQPTAGSSTTPKPVGGLPMLQSNLMVLLFFAVLPLM